MSKYPQALIQSATGILEQLTLAIICQELANRDYIPDTLRTDRTTDSVSWDVLVDNNQSNYQFGLARLELRATFPVVYVEKTVLLDNQIGDLDEKIYSINPINISDLSLPRKASYSVRSWKVGTLPTYLSVQNNSKNILERRIVALALHLQSIYGWIGEWNSVTNRLLELTYTRDDVIGESYNLPPLPQGSTYLQEIDKYNLKAVDLLIELSTKLILRPIKEITNSVVYSLPSELESISINTPTEETYIFGEEVSEGSKDPLSEPNSYLSETLYGDLSPSSGGGGSSNSPSQPNNPSPQEPQNTVPDC